MPAMPPVMTTNISLRDNLRQIGPDEQRRLDLADEDIGRGRQPHRAADVERLVSAQEKPRTIGGMMRQ